MQHHQEIANPPSSLGLTFSVSIAASDALHSPKTFSDSLCVISPRYGRCQDLGNSQPSGNLTSSADDPPSHLFQFMKVLGMPALRHSRVVGVGILPGCMKYISVCQGVLHQ
jgi:hypothetical protein